MIVHPFYAHDSLATFFHKQATGMLYWVGNVSTSDPDPVATHLNRHADMPARPARPLPIAPASPGRQPQRRGQNLRLAGLRPLACGALVLSAANAFAASCGAAPAGELKAERVVAVLPSRAEPGLYEGPVWVGDALYFSDFSFAKGFQQ